MHIPVLKQERMKVHISIEMGSMSSGTVYPGNICMPRFHLYTYSFKSDPSENIYCLYFYLWIVMSIIVVYRPSQIDESVTQDVVESITQMGRTIEHERCRLRLIMKAMVD